MAIGPIPKFVQYLSAFIAGAIGSMIPGMMVFHWPEIAKAPGYVAAGLIATGLFRLPSPAGKE